MIKPLQTHQVFIVTHLCYLEAGCGRRGTSMSGRREETTKIKQRGKKGEGEAP